MAQSKGKFTLYLAIAGVLGALGYFGYKQWRKAHPKNTDGSSDKQPPADATLPPADTKPEESPINFTTNPFKTKDEVKAFQQWIVNKYGKILGTSGSNKDGVDGLWGQKTASSWDKYGKTYMTTVSTSTTTTTTSDTTPSGNVPTEVQQGINYIVSKASGSKASQTYLSNLYKQYPSWAKGWILTWADTIQKRIASGGQSYTAFAYKNDGVWDSYSGTLRMNFNPLGKKLKIATSGANLWSNNYFGSATTSPAKGQDLGEGKAISFSKKDDVLFVYVPDNTYSKNYKWALAGQITTL